MTPVLLGLIGLALALPVPALLARTTWPLSTPRAGIILWQSLALAAILAMSGAGLSTALWLVSVDGPSLWRVITHAAILMLGFVVWGRFWWSAWTVWNETHQRRNRHRHLVDLLDTSHGVLPAVRILSEQTPVAYCLPGRHDARVVISHGTMQALAPHELNAVLAHERAHVRARHDLVLEGFGVLHRAFPRVLRTDAPLTQSQVMVELLADDIARRAHGPEPVARAILALAGSPTPDGALGSGGAAMVRMARLAEPHPRHLGAAVAAYSISAVVLIAPTVLLAVPWMLTTWNSLIS